MNLNTVILVASLMSIHAVAAQETAEQAEALNEQRINIEVQMREAEIQLAEAARKIAELSERNMPMVAPDVDFEMDLNRKPRLGVAIRSSSDDDNLPVEGVTLTGITPGSAAADAGLRAGDVLTAISTQSLSAANNREANEKLIEFMATVNDGEELDVEYLRDGSIGKLTLTPRIAETRSFIFSGRPGETTEFLIGRTPNVVVAPHNQHALRFGPGMFWSSRQWSDMELVELSEGLGRYFGATSGLLVVRVPDENEFKLKDGDVITSVDDREPDSVGHLMRILASYEPGESLELRIMRDQKRETIKLQMPVEQIGSVFPAAPRPPEPLRPAAAQRPPFPAPTALVEIRT